MIIRKVWKAKRPKQTDQLMITIPLDCGIKAGDYVRIEKVKQK